MVHSGDVALGEVDDMDEIAHPGAVWGGIIVAVDLELGDFAGADFHDDGHEIIGAIVGIFAKETGGVSADGIKITQDGDF